MHRSRPPRAPRRRHDPEAAVSRTLRALALSVAALVVSAACAPVLPAEDPGRDRPGAAKRAGKDKPDHRPGPRTPRPTERLRPGTQVRVPLAEAVAALPVAAERRAGYDRDLFDHWVDADTNGCDTRDEVLITQNRDPGARLGSWCTIVGGEWFSYYDQVTTTSASSFDVDHMVPLAEAWDSGAHAWGPGRRTAFANDLGDRRALIAVTAGSNRTKSDADPTGWMPAYQACVYVSSWVAVKTRWRLSVDPAEAAVLAGYAGRCGRRMLVVRVAKLAGASTTDARPSDASALPAAAPVPAQPGGGGQDPRFGSCTEAIGAGYGPYVKGRDPEYAWYRDGDGDGVVCES